MGDNLTTTIDRRRMREFERVQLWLKIHERADLLRISVSCKMKVIRRIAFEFDMKIHTVRRILKQKLR